MISGTGGIAFLGVTVHLALVTKYRRGVFTAEIMGDLSTKGIYIQIGKQAQRCFKPNDPEEKVRDT